jgi:two-component system chemotaxis response regulator CheY
MIVDDNERMRKAIIEIVALPKDQILECETGESAVNNYNKFNPDWILMDIQMKGMDGMAAAKKIKDKDPAVKIAFVTKYDDKVYRTAAKSIGVKFYFLKNDLLKIRETINKY